MKNYLKLVNFEINRFSKLYYALIIVIIGIQLIPFVIYTKQFAREINRALSRGQTTTQILANYGSMSLSNVFESKSFIISLVIGVVVLVIYIFFIWYRDWFAKSSFIYRLLTLPTNRINIYFSKLTAIFLMIFGLVVVQYGLLFVEQWVIQSSIPRDFRMSINMYQALEGSALSIILPSSILQFLLHYAAGFVVITVLFTAILFERSYRLIGVLYGVLYSVLTLIIFILPFILLMYVSSFNLYPNELAWIMFSLGILITACSIWLSYKLINTKVTV